MGSHRHVGVSNQVTWGTRADGWKSGLLHPKDLCPLAPNSSPDSGISLEVFMPEAGMGLGTGAMLHESC